MAKHLYLFTLEVMPMKVGDTYDELPLHCTFMHRFYSELSTGELSDGVRPLFNKTPPITLTAYEHTKLDSKQVPVSLIKLTEELDDLNMQLYSQLNKLGVEYTAPQWVGKGHVFHVTNRKREGLEIGGDYVSKAVYLIEVVNHQRVICHRFTLAEQPQNAQRFDAKEYWPDTESEAHFFPAATLPSLPMTAAVMYAFQDDEILLIKNGRGWDIPGGHIEPGESPEQTIRRELEEEAAAKVEQTKLVGYLQVTRLKDNERNKKYPAVSSIVVYKGEGIHLDEYSPHLEATGRKMLPVEQLADYHHNWSEMKRQIVAYVREL